MEMGFEWIPSVLQDMLRTVLSMWGMKCLSGLGVGHAEEESKESRICFTCGNFSESSDGHKPSICWNQFFYYFWGVLTANKLLWAYDRSIHFSKNDPRRSWRPATIKCWTINVARMLKWRISPGPSCNHRAWTSI